MELGNLCFGNSRGNFELSRGEGFEEELNRLFEAIDPTGNYVYEKDFDNDIFTIFPYYWGDCSCGYENIEYDFKEEHAPDCYQTLVRNEKYKKGWTKGEYWDESPKGMKYDEYNKIEDKIRQKYCKQLDLPFPEGCSVHCTCDYSLRFQDYITSKNYPDGHKADCLLLKHNFVYKPTGFCIDWYKYPLRDSYTNQEITLEEFKKIIDDCIKSL